MPKVLNDDQRAGNPRAASVRIGSNTVSGYSNQRRHDLRIGPQPQYVDQDRLSLNRVLIEHPGPAAMRKIACERRAVRETDRAMKSNAAIATAGVITFGAEAAQMFEQLTAEQQDAAFGELAEAVADRLKTSLHGLVVHLDEATIHAHFTLSAYDYDGHPLSKTTRPGILSELQDLTAEVMGRHCPGVERGRRYGDRLAAGADLSDVVHRSVRELHRDLPRDLEAKRANLAELAEAETLAKDRVAEIQARINKLIEKGQLTAKEFKRLETYRKRETERLAELVAAQKASEDAKVSADAQAAAVRVSAEAKANAFDILAGEVEAGTLKRNAKKMLIAANPTALRAGGPEIVRAAHALVASQEAVAQKMLDADRVFELARQRERDAIIAEAAAVEREQEAQSLVLKLKGLLTQVKRFLSRPDLPTDAVIYARHIEYDADNILTSEEPSDDSDGPRF